MSDDDDLEQQRKEFFDSFGLDDEGNPPDLDSDLVPYIHTELSGLVCLKHPLVFEVPYSEMLNGRINTYYAAKQEAVQAAEAAENWSQYIWLHERPYRLGAFYGIRDLLSDEDYWSYLSMIWQDTENMWQEIWTWHQCLESDRAGRSEFFMDEDDRKVLDSLPDYFPIYRGTSEGLPPGLSWTINRERAEWFARRFIRAGKKPFLLSGFVAKGDVIAYLGGRNEEEIVTRFQAIQDIHKTELTRDNP